MIRTAVIGVSGYGRIIYDLCQECVSSGQMRLDAIVIRTPSKVPDVVEQLKGSPCRVFPDIDSMLDAMSGQLDLVCIPTGIETHASMSIAAMKAGAHVMVEKPAAGSSEEIDAMKEATIATGKTLAVGFQDIYRKDIQSIKQGLVNEKWGKLEEVSILGSWPRPLSYYERNSWAGKLHKDGAPVFDSPANNALAHFLNLGLFLLGKDFNQSGHLTSIKADLRRAYNIESFDTIVLKGKTKSGVMMHYAVSHVCEENFEPLIKIKTTHKEIHLTHDSNRLYDRSGQFIEELHHEDTWTGRRNILPSIINHIDGKEDLYCDLNIAGQHTCLIERIHNDFKIWTFPNESLGNRVEGEDEFLTVKGLWETMKMSSEQSLLMNELDSFKSLI
jgi:predicted dehydrogenase